MQGDVPPGSWNQWTLLVEVSEAVLKMYPDVPSEKDFETVDLGMRNYIYL